MLTNTQQKQAHSEDVTFTLEQQHKKVMDEIHRLYSESIASYESALIERVSHRTRSLSSSLVRYAVVLICRLSPLYEDRREL